MDELFSDFLTETNEGLAALDAALLQLERTPDHTETLSAIFRLVHTLKGTCGFLGLPRLEALAHGTEGLLERLRDRTLRVTPDRISLMLKALDRIRATIAQYATAGDERPDLAADTALLLALERAAQPGRSTCRADAPETVPANPSQNVHEANAFANLGPGGEAVRVSGHRLDHLMRLASELIRTRDQLLQLAQSGQSSLRVEALQRLDQLASELHQGISTTRLQPIAMAWTSLPRLVRDLGMELGKKVDLVLMGGEIEIHRHLLGLIQSLLLHLVRNAVDHGLERAAARAAAGKPEAGCIRLTARQQAGRIAIEVADDGAGLQTEQIHRRALASNLATPDELADKPDAEIHRLIFCPGLSTRDSATAVSGRGVGLDVARTEIERIGGTIKVVSSPGKGCTFSILIPRRP